MTGLRNSQESRSNTFPRSERVKSHPRRNDTLGASFPAVLVLESCDFADEKMRMLQGSKNSRSLRGKVLDLDSGRWWAGIKPASEMG